MNTNIKVNNDGTISPIDPTKPSSYSTTPEPSELEEILLTFAAKSKPTDGKLWYGEENMTAALSALQSLIDTQTKLATTQLLDSLYWMYTQYCGRGHDFMGAGEFASELLENAGYITVDRAGQIIKDNGDSEEQRLREKIE